MPKDAKSVVIHSCVASQVLSSLVVDIHGFKNSDALFTCDVHGWNITLESNFVSMI